MFISIGRESRMPTIDELTAQLRAGDISAVCPFAEMRRNRLLAFIEGRISLAFQGKIEAEDIYQEMLITAMDYFPRMELRNRDPFGWLCDIADQRLIDAVRKFSTRKRSTGQERYLDHDPSGSQTTPSFAAIRNEQEAKLYEALAKLTDSERELIRLRYEESMSAKEMGKRLGKSSGAVRLALFRALASLRDHFGGDLPVDLL
jgi:RNA polymerase sigma-70 factor (ECF subfamily)